MMNQPNTHKPSWKTFFTAIFVVLLNWYLINRLIYSSGVVRYFFNLLLTIFINLFILWLIRRKRIKVSNVQAEKTIDAIRPILDSMGYAKALDEQYLEGEPMAEDVSEDTTTNTLEPTIKILKPKQMVHQKGVYDKAIQPQKYGDDLYQHLLDMGLSIDKNNIREWFASLAASKLMILDNEYRNVAERFIEISAEYIGAPLFKTECAPETTLKTLWKEDSAWKDCLTMAKQKPHLIHIMVFTKVAIGTIDMGFRPIVDYALNPLLPVHIGEITQNDIEELPTNVWFVLIPNKFDSKQLSQDMIQSSVTLELNAKVIEPKEVVTQNPIKLSYENFINLLFDGYEAHFLDESEWKKIDQIEQYVRQSSNFKIDNRYGRQLERYTSAFMLFGGEKNQSIDSVMHAKLLRYIGSVQLYKQSNNDDNLLALFEKLFGLENLIKTKVLLKDIQEVEPVQQPS
jgi:hypothetical protein